MKGQHLPVLQTLNADELLPTPFNFSHTWEENEDSRRVFSGPTTGFQLNQLAFESAQQMCLKAFLFAWRAVVSHHWESASLTGQCFSALELTRKRFQLQCC